MDRQLTVAKRSRRVRRLARGAITVIGLLFWSCLGLQSSPNAPPHLLVYPYLLPLHLWSAVLFPAFLLSLLVRSPTLQAFLGGTLFLNLFYLGGPIFRPSEPLETPRLRVVSANVQSFDPDFPEILERLKALEPDILLLQELWGPINTELAHAVLSDYHFRGDTGYFQGTTVASRLPLEAPSREAPNNSQSAIVDIAGKRILLLSLHGRKVQDLGPAGLARTLETQHDQAEELLVYLKEMSLPVILGGDFNSPAHTSLGHSLSQELQDGFLDGGSGYGLTFPSRFPALRLDRILFSKELATSVRCQTQAIGSDHRIVILDLRLPQLTDEPSRPGGDLQRTEK